MTLHITRLFLLLASLTVATCLQAAVITYNFTATGGYSGSFSYDNTVTSNGQIPFGQNGPSYAGLSFELNNVQQVNPVIQIFNDYQGIHDIIYFTTFTGGPAIQLWGDNATIGSANLSELDNIELADFSVTASNTLYTGVYPQGATALLSFSNGNATATPTPMLPALLGLGILMLGFSRRMISPYFPTSTERAAA